MLTYLLYNGIGRVTKDLQEMSTKVDIAIAREAEGCWGHPGVALHGDLAVPTSAYLCSSRGTATEVMREASRQEAVCQCDL